MEVPGTYVEYVAAAWGVSALCLAVVSGRALMAARRVRARLRDLENGE